MVDDDEEEEAAAAAGGGPTRSDAFPSRGRSFGSARRCGGGVPGMARSGLPLAALLTPLGSAPPDHATSSAVAFICRSA